MRIGIDMLGEQSVGSRGGGRPRGIGRYTLDLVHKLIELGTEHEFVLYYHEGLPHEEPPCGGGVTVRQLLAASQNRTAAAAIGEIADTNPDRIDILLSTTPLDLTSSYNCPRQPIHGPLQASIVYDLIPAVFQERYLTDPGYSRRYYSGLHKLKQYDLLLSISEATRQDFLQLLGIPAERIVNISTASDPEFFVPDTAEPMPEASRKILERYGIEQPYVFNLGGMDDRKNAKGLITAFQMLPSSIRRSHQLVITCAMLPEEVAQVREFAQSEGLHRQLVLTNAVSDEALRVLYQRCAAFVFPSTYEGFGLPLLEALHCGAVVIAGNNSSQVEVVGDAGLLVQVDDVADISNKLLQVLQNTSMAADLKRKAVLQGAKFSWEQTGQVALAAIEECVHRRNLVRKQQAGGLASKPRIAMFSPLPPKCSGIADYTVRLLDELSEHYTIDIYHEPGYQPDQALSSDRFVCRDYRLFPRVDRALSYHNIVYQMGNSSYHKFIYEMMQQYPGVVTLHDFSLAGFQYWYAAQPGVPHDHFLTELRYSNSQHAEEFLRLHDVWGAEPGGLIRACARRGIHLNRRVLEHATRVIVHDPWGREKIQQLYPGYLEKTGVVPHGAAVYEFTAEQRAEVRRQFGIRQDALVFASFGILSSTKMNVEAIEAFASLAEMFPAAVLVFVGREIGYPDARNKVIELGLAERVRFLGHQPLEAFVELASVTDVAINLRRPPTNGETSGSLLTLLGCGVPTIINDVDTFISYPDHAVKRISWDAFGSLTLREAMRELAADTAGRLKLSRAATEYIRASHSWPRVARLYAELIDDSARRSSERRSVASRPVGLQVA